MLPAELEERLNKLPLKSTKYKLGSITFNTHIKIITIASIFLVLVLGVVTISATQTGQHPQTIDYEF